MQLLTSLFTILIVCALLLVVPIRNTVESTKRPWATWGLIAATLAGFVVAVLAGLFGELSGLGAALQSMVFTGDPSRPWQLITAQFVSFHPIGMLIWLWFLYLIGPPLEEKINPVVLILLYVLGGAVAYALYGMLANSLGASILLAGPAPSLCVLLGCYLILHPFEEIVFFYNFLFFRFAGTVRVATFYLVLLTILLHVISGIGVVSTVFGFGTQQAGPIDWLDEAAVLAGLAIGCVAGAIRFGFGAFVGEPTEDEERKVAERKAQRVLSRIGGPVAVGGDGISRRERAQARASLEKCTTPEQIEAFAQECLSRHHDEMLESAFERFRFRFPDRSFGPGLLAAIARRFVQTGRTDEAVDAFRMLVRSYEETPIASQSRLELARLLLQTHQSPEECIDLLEAFIASKPPRDAANEARRLLLDAAEAAGKADTYTNLNPEHKPFRFETPLSDEEPAPRKPIGRSAEEIYPADEFPAAQAPKEAEASPKAALVEPQADTEPELLGLKRRDRPKEGEHAAEPLPSSEPADDEPITIENLRVGQIVPDSGDTLSGTTAPVTPAATLAEAKSFAVIMLPEQKPISKEILALLANFWSLDRDQAMSWLRNTRGVLLDDVPSGRALVAARKLRNLGLPVGVVPLTPDLVYRGGEDVLELNWDESNCSNITAAGRIVFPWSDVRLVNIGRVALSGSGSAYRRVLDVFPANQERYVRFWETTVHFARSRLSGVPVTIGGLAALAEYLDSRAPRAIKTPSFRAVIKKSGPPLDFHSPAELDHYNRWFLYAGFGACSGGE